MSPPLDSESSDLITDSGTMAAITPALETKQPASVGSLLRDGRVIALLAALILGGPGATAAVTSWSGSATVEQAMSAAKDGDEQIMQRLEEVGEQVEKVGKQSETIKQQQQDLGVSINGDVVSGEPGIKGTLKSHERKLDSLKGDIERIKKRDEKRDELEKLDKGLSDFPLARDPVWEGP